MIMWFEIQLDLHKPNFNPLTPSKKKTKKKPSEQQPLFKKIHIFFTIPMKII